MYCLQHCWQDLESCWWNRPVCIGKCSSSSGCTVKRYPHYVWFSRFWSHFHGTNALFASKAKINVVWNFSHGGCPKGPQSVEKISNNVDFSLWGNRATTWEYIVTFLSETKIMKIIHSVPSLQYSSSIVWCIKMGILPLRKQILNHSNAI